MHRPLGKRYYVVEVRAGTECRVAMDLSYGETRTGWIARPEYETYLPQRKMVRSRRGEKVVVFLPMIQGYVIARFDVRVDNWKPILSCLDVKRIMSTRASAPIAISDDDVDHLRKLSEADLGIDPLRMKLREPGACLRVVDGPFASFTAVCVECDGLSTSAQVEVFGRLCTVTLPWTSFEDRTG